MKQWQFKGLLRESGWLEPACVVVNNNGNVVSISDRTDPTIPFEQVNGWALPGFVNTHSHAFQYAMAGLAEHLPPGAGSDDFWSWREAMYSLALRISPEEMEAVAAMLYAEMARLGYTAVAEFHYLHNDTDGTRYSNPAEMAERLVSAAKRAGIDITIIPMYYNQGGFDTEPSERQRRFLSSSLDDYYALVESTRCLTQNYSHSTLATGLHSLRAASIDDTIRLFSERTSGIPFHLHISEQTKEIDDCLNARGMRPVEWLLNNIELTSECHLVHATHIDPEEIQGIVKSGANVVLCPSTEGNLGDGFFPLKDFWSKGGHWSIGTDSHICLYLAEDLRILDYGARLSERKRNILCLEPGQDSGELALRESILTGRAALGNNSPGFFATGERFDAVILDAQYPLFEVHPVNRIISTFVYASDTKALLGTVKNGEWLVKKNHHRTYDPIRSDFIQAMKALKTRAA